MPMDRSKYLEQYKAEAREHIQNITNGLLKLERSPRDRDLTDYLMRETHTIKGTSMMMGYKRVADIAHAIEDGLQSALDRQGELAKAQFDIMLKGLDAMEPLLEDKLTWEENGVDRPFVEKICRVIKDVFAGTPVDPESIVMPKTASQTLPEAAPAPGTPELSGSEAGKIKDSMRVDVRKIDSLLDLSGEILVSRERVNELVRTLAQKLSDNPDETIARNMGELKETAYIMTALTSRMQKEMMKVRMIPVSYLFNSFPRAMRDLAFQKGKDVQLTFAGEDTQLDRNIISEIKDPLMHIVRNAIDHGLEPPEERLRKGKPAAGTILLKAFQKGSQVIVEITDDGSGINVPKVRAKAVELGLLTEKNVGSQSENQLFAILFSPHFTTQDTVSETSGRGVGLNVVSEKIRLLKGLVEVKSQPDKGTTFTIKLPLTLAVTENLIVSSGSENYAVPIHSVVETVRISAGDIRTVETKEAVSIRGHIVPLIRLKDVFQLSAKGIVEKKYFSVIVVQSAEKRLGILVDRIAGRAEIVLKALGDPLAAIPHIAGATILGDGHVILIIDVPSLIDSAQGIDSASVRPAERSARHKIARKKTILLAEDTLSTAVLEKNVLESVGYLVVLAKDGWEAFEKVKRESFDLVITDVLMPRVNGFELTEKIKKDPAYKSIPVIIVTTRESEADKRRGLEAGADAYILKSEFTAEGLLDTIEGLIG